VTLKLHRYRAIHISFGFVFVRRSPEFWNWHWACDMFVYWLRMTTASVPCGSLKHHVTGHWSILVGPVTVTCVSFTSILQFRVVRCTTWLSKANVRDFLSTVCGCRWQRISHTATCSLFTWFSRSELHWISSSSWKTSRWLHHSLVVSLNWDRNRKLLSR